MPTPSTATAGFNAGVFITSTPSLSMTNEALTDSGDHQTFNITNQAHQAWDYSAAFTVQTSPDGTTWSTVSSGFVINYAIGQVVFASPVSGTTPSCRISSGKYFPLSFLAGINSIEGTGTATVIDTTAAQNPPSPWKTFIAGELGATLKLGGWWVNGGLFLNHLSNDDILLLKTYPNQANTQRYQGYGKLTQDAIKSALGAAVSEELDFVINGKLYWVLS